MMGFLTATAGEALLGVASVGVAGLAARAMTSTPQMQADSRLARGARAVERSLASSAAPVVVGLVSACLVWWSWGSLRQVPVYHDERAYILQAQIFAAGHWVARPPPLTEFFEQFHVLVRPVVAAKYPPGHALTLAPGAWLGLPGLLPVLLSGLSGALVFALARRCGNVWIGVMAWWLWTTNARNLIWRASYFSEITTSAVWLIAWWLLLRWRVRPRRSTLAALGLVIGWGAITRPLTAVVLAIPIAVVVLKDAWRLREWGSPLSALAAGAAVLTLIPLWSLNTTGSWTLTPLALYTRTYIPWDHPGFGLDTTRSLEGLRPDQRTVESVYLQLNRSHTTHALPRILAERTHAIATDADRDWRKAIAIFAMVGLCVAPAEGLFAAITGALLVLAYLTYVHSPQWTIYYLELMPVLAWLAALGCWRTVVVVAGRQGKRAEMPRPLDAAPVAAPVAMILIVVATVPFAIADLAGVRQYVALHTAYHRSFERQVRALAPSKATVFVRYGPTHDANASLVGNVPNPSSARAWIAYDRGDTNLALVHAAPDRVPFLFDDARDTLVPLAPAPGQ